MSMTIDNDNVHAPFTGDRWTPRLDGNVFCSPACGHRCTKADFDHATARAAEIADQLGDGWRPHVWENCGWNFEVKKGVATVSVDSAGRYTATIEFGFTDRSVERVSETQDEPRHAMQCVIDVLNSKIATLKRTLISVSLESLTLSED